MPTDILKQIKKSGIDLSTLDHENNFEVLLNVLRFATKQTFKTQRQYEQEKKEEKESKQNALFSESVDEECNAPPAILIRTGEFFVFRSYPDLVRWKE